MTTKYEQKLKEKIEQESYKKVDNLIQQNWDKYTSPNHRVTGGPGESDKYVGGGPGAMTKRKAIMNRLNDRKLQDYFKREEKRREIKNDERSA